MINHLYALHNKGRRVDAVVAWRLPESQTMSLYAIGRPVLIGMPSANRLLEAINHPETDPSMWAADRRYAADLATREEMFARPRTQHTIIQEVSR